MNTIIAPSLLAADFANIQSEVNMLNQSEAEWIHFDVMDGVFVPNISFGFPVLEALKKYATKVLDVHLMIQEPGRYVDQFRAAGADNITVHYEACTHLHRTVQQIKDTGAKAGVALNPHTPVRVLSEIIQDLDLVLIMSVNPGFGGQKFIQRTFQKVKEAKSLIRESGSSALIEIDGGVNLQNAPALIEEGANVLVAGNFVFSSSEPLKTISALKNQVKS
ncbi:ribulose-phosphate 3-epimerase [Adhaeribacter rhizoryzae]|uniref:Ribulose-phosphate 3-epimerase n=1 Tax=Adhaeribacter rhizoryzae TaxID=2607907 RepID=A0A5M6DNB4_9BACT|nr:ribulose-phosphate 3-epimerase [Adhaeribacter rhizoryzae]KAA5547742.1 ribulose-phosphate 3-epimerase [Adhaeribacter rhizoryzae]